MSRRREIFKLKDLSDEQIDNLAHDSDDESLVDYDSDDSVGDPNYCPDPIEAETDGFIADALNAMASNETSTAFLGNLTAFDLSAIGEAASSTMQEVAAFETVNSSEEESVRPIIEPTIVGGSSAANEPEKFKKPKRVCSPMPTIEATGPSVEPNSGGFYGSGK